MTSFSQYGIEEAMKELNEGIFSKKKNSATNVYDSFEALKNELKSSFFADRGNGTRVEFPSRKKILVYITDEEDAAAKKRINDTLYALLKKYSKCCDYKESRFDDGDSWYSLIEIRISE